LWLMIPEAFDHGLLAPLEWTCDEAEQHGSGSMWQRWLLTSWQSGSRERQRKRLGIRHHFESYSVTHDLQSVSTFHSSISH
jgi:hypothetical protein